MSNVGIYKIINILNNKIYIGSSTQINKRWKKHKQCLRRNKHHSNHLQNAWNLYGEESFKIELLEQVEPSKEKLLEREDYWISFFNSANSDFGYNVRIKAGSCLGTKRSEETRKKMSEIAKKRVISEETKQKIAKSMIGDKNHFFGKHHTEASKHKCGARGENHGRSTLTLESVIEIRRLAVLGKYKFIELAKMFNVHNSQITRIVKNQIWRESNV